MNKLSNDTDVKIFITFFDIFVIKYYYTNTQCLTKRNNRILLKTLPMSSGASE